MSNYPPYNRVSRIVPVDYMFKSITLSSSSSNRVFQQKVPHDCPAIEGDAVNVEPLSIGSYFFSVASKCIGCKFAREYCDPAFRRVV